MAAFSFHCSERWPLGSPPFGFVTFWFLSPSVTLLLKAVTLKGKGFLSSSYSSGITLGSGHLLFTCGSCACVPNNRCQSGGRRCTHTDYATCSAGLDSYTGSCDLRFDASRERLGRAGGEHCPSVCSRALPVPRSVALYLHCKSLYIRGTRVSLYSCIWVDGIHVVCVCVRARHFSSSFLPHCDIITTVGMQTKLIFLFLIRV